MTIRPIIFSMPMVEALLAGRKTQTRRLASSPLRRVEVGDLLYVRETWAHYHTVNQTKRADGRAFDEISDGLAGYRADGHETIKDFREHTRLISGCDLEAVVVNGDRWRPSIHMPRWASRLTLEVTEVRPMLLQDTSAQDCQAEGHPRLDRDWATEQVHLDAASDWFRDLWDSLHDKPGERWEDNPEVIALTFRVHHCNVDAISALAQAHSPNAGSEASHA